MRRWSKRKLFPPLQLEFTWRALSEQSVPELRAKAANYRAMAATATTAEVMTALRKLAERLETLADQREAAGAIWYSNRT